MSHIKEKLKNIYEFIFTREIGGKLFAALLIYVLFKLFIEFMAHRGSIIFAVAASRLWLITGIFIIAVVVIRAIITFCSDIANKRIIYILGSAVIAILLLRPIFDPSCSVIGQDATQQLAAGLDAFGTDDWNYTGKAFLEYPARQYLLAALPAKILGRTQLALKLGFAWPFWAGLLVFGHSMRNYLKQNGYIIKNELLVIASVSALFAFPYITEYYIYFEHALFPVCFALQFIGWLLYLIRKPTLFNSIALIWSGSMLIYCYTTALSAVVLFIVIMGCMFLFGAAAKIGININEPAHILSKAPARFMSPIAGLAALAIGFQLVFSFAFGRGDRATELASENVNELIRAAGTGLRIGLTNDPAVYSSFYIVFLWIYLALSLLLILGKLHALISIWTIAIFILSQVLQGYAVYLAPISFSRTMVTVPVIITAWFIIAADLLAGNKVLRGISFSKPKNIAFVQKNKDKFFSIVLSVLIAANIAIGFYNISKPFVQGDASKYFASGHLTHMRLLMQDLNKRAGEAGLTADDVFDFVLYTDNVWFKNPNDYTWYFFPEARVYVLATGEHLPEEIDEQNPLLIYIIKGTPPDNVLAGLNDIETTHLSAKGSQSITLNRIVIIP